MAPSSTAPSIRSSSVLRSCSRTCGASAIRASIDRRIGAGRAAGRARAACDRASPTGGTATSKSMTQHAAGTSADGGLRLTTLDGRYHVLERIAAGGMGEVFRARDAVLDREVAIKVLHRSLAGDPGFVDRFRREARAAAGISHPNIVNVHDWGAVDGIYYMVMEYVRGRAVRDLLNAQGRLEPAQAADVLRQTLLALDHAHRRGHRPPRREAREHPRDDRRRREGGGLRPRARVRGRPADAGRHRDRHGPVPGAGADPRRAGRPAQRPVLPRHRRRSSCSPGGCPSRARRPWRSRTSTCPTGCPRPSALGRRHPGGRRRVRGRAPPSATASCGPSRPRRCAATWSRSPASCRRPGRSSELVAEATPVGDPAGRAGRGRTGGRHDHRHDPRRARTKRRRLRRFLRHGARAGGLVAARLGRLDVPRSPTAPRCPPSRRTSVEEARAQLEADGFVVRIAKGQYDLQVRCRRRAPRAAGARHGARGGRRRDAVPSLGPQPLDGAEPDRGRPSRRRAQALVDARFRVGGIDARCQRATCPKGRVIGTRPGRRRHGARAERDHADRQHRPAAAARAQRRQQGRRRRHGRARRPRDSASRSCGEFSDRIPLDQVISQEPGANVTRPYESTVTLIVSRRARGRSPSPTYIGLDEGGGASRRSRPTGWWRRVSVRARRRGRHGGGPDARPRHHGAARRHDHDLRGVRIGAHLRRQGRAGIHGALEGTSERGADCAQLFISNAARVGGAPRERGGRRRLPRRVGGVRARARRRARAVPREHRLAEPGVPARSPVRSPPRPRRRATGSGSPSWCCTPAPADPGEPAEALARAAETLADRRRRGARRSGSPWS